MSVKASSRHPRTCRQCGKEFKAFWFQILKGGGNFCSQPCFHAYPNRGTLEERFWSHVDKSNADGCWLWTAATHTYGYGRLFANGVVTEAHRVSYELNVGPIPDGMHVCHRCDNPPCVRPEHLFLGTNTENRRDSVRKNRHAHGVKQGGTKLTDEIACTIRKRFASGETNKSALAREYGVTSSCIHDVLTSKTWKHAR